MADEPDDQLPPDPQSGHDEQLQTDAGGRNGAGSPGQDNASQGGPSKAEIMRASRAREAFIKQMCMDLGITEKEAIAQVARVELLRPSSERMSTRGDVAERLARALDETFGNGTPLIKPKSAGLDWDLSDVDGSCHMTKPPLGDILKSDKDLLYALVILERLRGDSEARMMEYENQARMLRLEFVRRSHIHETWRHMVRKGFMPLISALIAAGVKYDDIKLNSALLNALLQTIADWHRSRTGKDIEPKGRTGSVLRGKELLQEAARATEDELLATMREGFAASATPEDFAAMQNRLTDEIDQLQKRIEAPMGDGNELENDGVDVKSRLEQLQRIKAAGGGIDKAGRVVLQSPEAFVGVTEGLELSEVGQEDPRQEPLSEGGPCQEVQLAAEEPSEAKPRLTEEQLQEIQVVNADQWEEIRQRLPRSQGIARSIYKDAYAGWNWRPPAFGLIPPLRSLRDIPQINNETGDLTIMNWWRFEVGPGRWRLGKNARIAGESVPELIGYSHPVVFPPHSSLRWYGERLGWSTADCDKLASLGSPDKPETITASDDLHLLLKALRLTVKNQIDDFESWFSDPKRKPYKDREDYYFIRSPGAKKFFVESFARYWLFILLARHKQEYFDQALGTKFFHGVIGPDFSVSMKEFHYSFGAVGGYFVQIFAPDLMQQNQSSTITLEAQFQGDDLETRQPLLSTILVAE